jgi:CRP/FNR family nitrogen fixation transcriptional regulator
MKSLVPKIGQSSLSSLTSGQTRIDRMAFTRLLSRGEKVFRKGQSAKQIYKVDIGCIRTSTHDRNGCRLVTGFYFPGDYFGLELRGRHSVFAEAIVPSKILVIGRKELFSAAEADSAVANCLLNITNVELQRAQNHSLMLRSSANERVAHFLIELKKRNRRAEVDLPMSRQDIADYLNLAMETVSRALTRLEKVSAISFRTYRRITVRTRKRLAA